jgi:hypothetical protein
MKDQGWVMCKPGGKAVYRWAQTGTVETIRKLKFELLPQPQYNQDLAPADYHIFGPVRNALHWGRDANDKEVKVAVRFFPGNRKGWLQMMWAII